MAATDWDDQTGTLVNPDVTRGVTSGITPPNGGGTWVYGANSITAATGVAAIRVDLAGVNPTSSGGQISCALRRGSPGSGVAPFVWCMSGTQVTDTAYILGLSDADPARIILRKGRIVDGIPDLTPDPTVNGNLLASTATYAWGTWVHVRLKFIDQPTNDVLLVVEQNEDLATNDVTAPVWTVPAGMEGSLAFPGFLDDQLQINTGSAPLNSGFLGVGIYLNGLGKKGFVDHFKVAYQ